MLARQAAADVHDRWIGEEGAAVVLSAVAARDKKRTDQGEANLAAMDMAGQHQVDMVAARPADIVRRMAKKQAEYVLGAGRQVWKRRKPRALVADHQQRLAADVDSLPGIRQDIHADFAETAANDYGVAPGVVVAQNRERSNVPTEPAQNRHYPAMMPKLNCRPRRLLWPPGLERPTSCTDLPRIGRIRDRVCRTGEGRSDAGW